MQRLGYRSPAPGLGQHSGELSALWTSRPSGRAPADVSPPADVDVTLPFAGVRVIDFGVYIFGAEAGRLLADLGADVIKVENRGYPDGTRMPALGPMNATFAVGHRNERSFGVDLRTAAGVELVKKLVAGAGVVISNFKPGTLERLGLGYEELSRLAPGLVWMSGSGFGDSGPWADWLGYGPLVRSGSGVTALWRYPDDDSGFGDLTTIYPDHLSGRVAAVAILAALIRQRRTGLGADIRVSQAESSINQLAEAFAVQSLGLDAAAGAPAPSGLYPCAGDDEWCAITARDDDEWHRLVATLGSPDWAADARFATAPARVQHRADLDAALAASTAEWLPDELMAMLQATKVPAGTMRRRLELQADPQLAARQFLTRVEQPGLGGALVMQSRSFVSRRIPVKDHRPAPLHGEHTVEVCREILGMAPDHIDQLIADGVLQSLDGDALTGNRVSPR